MRDWPTDPMRQHNRFIQAVCDDLIETGKLSLFGPKASRVSEINRQVNAERNSDPTPTRRSRRTV